MNVKNTTIIGAGIALVVIIAAIVVFGISMPSSVNDERNWNKERF